MTLKKKELIWRKVDEDVNTEDAIGHGHTAVQVKKAWKNVKRAILEKQRKSTATTGIEGEGHSSIPFSQFAFISYAEKVLFIWDLRR